MLACLLLPPAVLLWCLARRRGADWRTAVLLAALGWGLSVLLITEALSVITQLTRTNVAAAWAILSLILLLLLRRITPAEPSAAVPIKPADRLAALHWIVLSLLATLLGAVLLIALLAPPDTYDSMTYHMPRVMHWIQNQSVAAYPTHIVRQVQQCPLAEYGILHFVLLADGDRFANLPQYLAMLGSLVAVSLIAKSLGARPRGQMMAALVCGTLPMGMLQASSTQNDYAAGFWLVCAVALLLPLLRGERVVWPIAIAAALAMGLAMYTKATTYLYLSVLLGAAAVVLVGRFRWRGLAVLAAMVLIAVSLNLPHYTRNMRLSGRPLGPAFEVWEGVTSHYANEQLDATTTLTNLLRNTTLQLTTPWPTWNAPIEQTARAAMMKLGLDPDQTQSLWRGTQFRLYAGGWGSDDYAFNPLHLILAVLAAASAVLLAREHRWWALGYALVLLGMLVCFSGYLRWQEWHCRLMLPIAVASAPLVGLVADRVWRGAVIYLLAGVLIAAAVPYLLYPYSRPLLGPRSVLYNDRDHLRPLRDGQPTRLASLVQSVKQAGIQDLGVVIEGNEWEYPLWVALRDAGLKVHMQHVDITNWTAILSESEPYKGFHPQAVVHRDRLVISPKQQR